MGSAVELDTDRQNTTQSSSLGCFISPSEQILMFYTVLCTAKYHHSQQFITTSNDFLIICGTDLTEVFSAFVMQGVQIINSLASPPGK